MDGKPIYGKSRFPKTRKREDGKKACRGCGGEITDTRRQTWCSHECHLKFDPMYVRLQVISRDNHICKVCKIDIKKAKQEWLKIKPAFSFNNDGEYTKWSKQKPKEEYHHILEFSEGGLTTLENMITICNTCHKKLTAEFMARKAKERKDAKNNKEEQLTIGGIL